jgi:hypothetical protein
MAKPLDSQRNRLQEPESPITDADLEAAPQENEHALRLRIGHPVRSLVQEAMAQQISLEQQLKEFEPSARAW